jgi:hypothetical protein
MDEQLAMSATWKESISTPTGGANVSGLTYTAFSTALSTAECRCGGGASHLIDNQWHG